MLGQWRSHKDYQKFVVDELASIARFDPSRLLEFEVEISKLYILNLDSLLSVIAPLYSHTGRPSESQPEMFRAFILMNHLKIGADQLVEKLKLNAVLRIICGFTPQTVPGVASFYDFIDRIIKLDERPKLKKKKRKPTKKLGKNVKMPPKHPGVVGKLVDRIKVGRQLRRRPELVLQKIFAEVCVKRSIDLGLVKRKLDVSGDGTCIKTGASHYGVKVCECESFRCECPRRFSDPNAAWGWDSHNERYFYGYTGYFISTYNRKLKKDLPLCLRLVDARRHDSVSAVVALAEFRDLYPHLIIDTFISDSASDNYTTYELLDHWGINAVIALNPTNNGNAKYPSSQNADENGTPLCPGGKPMVYNGFCKGRSRLKWRCPRALGKAEPCENCKSCSPSKYGRVIYTKPNWDLRLFTRIPRGSHQWKLKMRSRTCAERINNRILHNYGVENAKTRGKKRISFFATIAAFNVHLDAQLATLKERKIFDFSSVFGVA